MPIILILAVLAVLLLSRRSPTAPAAATTADGGYAGTVNQAPPPTFTSSAGYNGPVDRSGGQLGVDAQTGLPFTAGSTFSQIAGGQLPFTVQSGTAVRSYAFTAPGQVPPPALPHA